MKLKEQFEECMKQIEFDRILSVMEYIDWKRHSFEIPKIPNEQQVRETFERLFKDTKKNYKKYGNTYSSTGGCEVSIVDKKVAIKFILTEGTY